MAGFEKFSRRSVWFRGAAVLLLNLCLAATGAGSDGALPTEGRMIYFGPGEPRDLVPWSELRRDDFLAEAPPGPLASHAGLIGAVSCIGINIREDASPAVTVERLPTGEKRYVARVYRPRFTAVFDRICSWWNPETDDPEYLLDHEQIHFDIAEAAARRLGRTLVVDESFKARSRSRSDALAKLHVLVGIAVKRALINEQERHELFDRETSDVRSRARQQRWAERVRAEIATEAARARGQSGG